MKPSEDYERALELSKEQHLASKTYSGKFLRPYVSKIKPIIDRLGIKSALDYGCGKGLQYTWVDEADGLTIEQKWGFKVAKYDPAFGPFAAEPVGTFDFVICTHVLGVIPLPDLDWVVDRIYGFANKAVFVVVRTGKLPSESKARWRVDNIPRDWVADQWIDLLTRRKLKDIEVHLCVKSDAPGHKTGDFLI